MTNHARFFKRALQERLEEYRQKQAFVPMTAKQGQQAAGPGGMPVAPGGGGGGAPMDPAMMGGAPMDPAMMGGAPPPGGGGMPPPPMDPAAGGGAPPLDPMAAGGGDPMAGLPPLPGGEELPPLPGEEGMEEGGEGDTSISGGDVEALKGIQQNTMDIVRQALEMVGKAKPQEAAEGDGKAAEQAEPPPPEAQPGPVTGQPGFSPDMVGGPLKLGEAVKAKLAQSQSAAQMASDLALRNRRLSGLGHTDRSERNRRKAREQAEERQKNMVSGRKVTGGTTKGVSRQTVQKNKP